MIIELDDLMVGLIVDRVTEVIRIAEEDIEPPSPLLAGVDTPICAALANLKKKKKKANKKTKANWLFCSI